MSHHTYAPSRQGTVLLDIGGEIGAIVVHTPPHLHGHRIEVSPAAEPRRRAHAAVRSRLVRGGVGYSMVLGGLRQGRYVVWRDADTPLGEIDVRGGSVAEVTWSIPSVV